MQENPPAIVNFRTKAVLIMFGVFLFFALLEIGLRLGGFVLLSIQEYRNRQTIQQKGSYRIMCLGESTTQGQYPKFLEKFLNQRNIGVHFSVIDKGLRGTKTPIILSNVEAYLNEFYPDMVIAMMGINDYGEYVFYEASITSKIKRFFKSFRTYKLARFLRLHILAKAKEIGIYKINQDSGSFGKIQANLPNNDKAYTELGLDYKLQGKLPQALGSFRKAIELNPRNYKAYAELGVIYRIQGKLPQAADSFKKVIELNPKNVNAYNELGLIYRFQAKFRLAEESYKKLVELNPDSYDAYTGLGWFYVKFTVKYLQAEGVFKKAIELNPKLDNAYLGLGLTYLKQSQFSQAEDEFKKALEVNPKNTGANISLGKIYQEEGKLFQAEGFFKKAIELSPNDDSTNGAILVFYEETGKPELAKEYAKKINRFESYLPVTVNSYHKFKEILDKKGIRLVCVQYPMRSIDPLKRIFKGDEEGLVFVDNEGVFKEAVRKLGHKEVFRDMFGGDFGHCTKKGNQLLGKNIAEVILKEVFRK